MRKSSAIRAAMRLRKWCKGRSCSVDACIFCDKDCGCVLYECIPSGWPIMSFYDKEEVRDATD